MYTPGVMNRIKTQTVVANSTDSKPLKTENPEYTQARRGRDDRMPPIARSMKSARRYVDNEAVPTGMATSHQALEPSAIRADTTRKSIASAQAVSPTTSRRSMPETPTRLTQERWPEK
jgi:hypothetical protein